MNQSKIFFLNGYKFFTTKDLTINHILQYFNYQNSLFVIEYNNLICDKSEWPKIKISQNDVIEIITIVGGG
jgi:thiamine biosynthesis protein ThiS